MPCPLYGQPGANAIFEHGEADHQPGVLREVNNTTDLIDDEEPVRIGMVAAPWNPMDDLTFVNAATGTGDSTTLETHARALVEARAASARQMSDDLLSIRHSDEDRVRRRDRVSLIRIGAEIRDAAEHYWAGGSEPPELLLLANEVVHELLHIQEVYVNHLREDPQTRAERRRELDADMPFVEDAIRRLYEAGRFPDLNLAIRNYRLAAEGRFSMLRRYIHRPPNKVMLV